MKKVFIYLVLCSFTAHGQMNKESIEHFKKFRFSVYKQEKDNLCNYFDFPINGIEIWQLAKGLTEEESTKIKPFERKDFLKYHSNIFDSKFRKSIQKVKSNDLRMKGHYETEQFRDKDTVYSMNINYDKLERKLTMSLLFEYPFVEEDGYGKKRKEVAEFSVIYIFKVLSTGRIKFHKVMFAG